MGQGERLQLLPEITASPGGGRQALLHSGPLLAGASAEHGEAAHSSRFPAELCGGLVLWVFSPKTPSP